MKLKNKKTKEIAKLVGYVKTGNDRMFFRFEDNNGTYKKEYNSLAELNEEWEDYEEPKEYWYISPVGKVYLADDSLEGTKESKEIGNYFETKEEAEKAVEKLKAWKRLKDKGFRFIEGYLDNNDDFIIKAKLENVGLIDRQDVHLLFGGEE